MKTEKESTITKADAIKQLSEIGITAEIANGILWIRGVKSCKEATRILKSIGYTASFGIKKEAAEQ